MVRDLQGRGHSESSSDGSFGSGQCDRNGCFARVGGPQAPQWLYGAGKQIDSMRPFEVEASVDADGARRSSSVFCRMPSAMGATTSPTASLMSLPRPTALKVL